MSTPRPLRTANLNSHVPAKMHIHKSGLGGINRVAATGRISAAVAHHEGEVTTERGYTDSERYLRDVGGIYPLRCARLGWRDDAQSCGIIVSIRLLCWLINDSSGSIDRVGLDCYVLGSSRTDLGYRPKSTTKRQAGVGEHHAQIR